MHSLHLILPALILIQVAGTVQAENWPQFRGPTGLGYTVEKNLPLTWDGATGENVVWKSPLVGEGHASPVVWGERVIVCTARFAGGKADAAVMPEHHVVCYRTTDGKQLWDTQVQPGPWLRSDFRSGAGGGYAAPTPATDGRQVFVLFGSSVLAALDFDGKIAWRQEIKPHTFDVTIGSSPVLFGDTVILFCAMSNSADSRLVAFAKTDGKVRWETKLPRVGFGHSTPVVIDVKGKPQIIVLASGMGVKDEALQSFDPTDGRRLWWCKGAGDASSPAYGSGIIYSDSGRGGSGTAVDPTGAGDVSTTHIKWTAGPLPECIASPIIVGDHVFRLQGSGVVKVWNVADGMETDRQRLDKIGSTWASPIADGDGRIYFASGGKSYVVQSGAQIKVLAANDLGDANHASAAVANGRLYILGLKNLYCIGTRAVSQTSVSSRNIAQSAVDFGREVQPIFAKRCFSCHGPDKAKSGLRLNERKSALAEADSGERAVVPGDLEHSELIRRIASTDAAERMPPEGPPLTPRQIGVIRRWIEQGAGWEEHWAFQPLTPRSPPAVQDRTWGRNPIDAFILSRLEQNGLAPAAPADKIALLRRACYDLTGLPPPPAQVEQFVRDDAADAYEKLLDRLLDSPAYGERWGRHWLDLVRFAETNSFERDGLKPHAWRYRDYVIRAFNADKPYDRFIREQLAGDELPDATNDSLIATGYYRLGLWDDEPADRLLAKFDMLDDVVATTGQVFLGLTVNCARCHDHKLDPIPQHDYYSLLAFFHGLTPMGYGGAHIERPIFENDTAAQAYEAQVRELEKKRQAAQAQVTLVEESFRTLYQKSQGNNQPFNVAEQIKVHGAKLLGERQFKEYQVLLAALDKLRQAKIDADFALCATESGSRPPDTFVLARGNPHVSAEQVEPAFPALFAASKPAFPEPPPNAKSSGRRLVLANWIASPDNRLTARVLVNRVGQQHFGRGIVRSPSNFGLLGDRPTHPELLDWLATEFVKGGWRLKALHRLIMTSSAYRMSSRANAACLTKDPINDLFWRFDMRRLSAEEIRDSIHAVTGRLNSRMYGPGIYPEISGEVLAGQSKPGDGWGKSSPAEQARRSVYIHVKRSLITPILADFDVADTDSSCAARFSTTQPTQALGMLNGHFVHTQAAEFASRLEREAGSDAAAQIRLALKLALCHEPEASSVTRGVDLLKSLQEKHGIDRTAALRYYCVTVLNLNEFIYLD